MFIPTPKQLAMTALLATAAVRGQNSLLEQALLEDFAAAQPGRWHDRVTVVADPVQGAVGSWIVPAKATADSVALNLGDWAPECNDWDELRFDYQLSEVPVWFGVKVTDYPLADGMQATWKLPVPVQSAGQWQTAVIDLHEPMWRWGDAPSQQRRAIDFRMQNNADHEVAVRIAKVRLIRRKIDLRGAVSVNWSEDGRHGDWSVTVRNRSQETLVMQVAVTSSDARVRLLPSLPQLTLAAAQEQSLTLALTCAEALPPLSLFGVTLAMRQSTDEGQEALRTSLEVTVPFGRIPVPSLLFTPAQLPELKRRLSEQENARVWWQGMLKKADDWLQRAPEYPPRGAQWWHWYSCKKCGVSLKTAAPTRHVCPQCQAEYSGWPYDDVVLSRDHDALANSVRDLGIVYQFSGDRRYAAKAHEILRGYAERYLDYPLHDINGRPNKGGGRVHPQTLDEAIWLIAMAQGFDAIKETLSAEEIEFLASKMLLPAALMIKDHQWGIHNICCWHASAYGLVGITLGDEQLIGAAINGPKGFRAQVDQGITVDGPWYEGAWGYHFYTMSALEPLAIAARNLGIDVHSERYKAMYDAPLKFLAPSYQLPAFHDSARVGFTPQGAGSRYEAPYAWWGDPLHAWVVAGSNRQSLPAVLWGKDELQAGQAVFASGAYDGAGVVVMRSQSPRLPAETIPCNYIALDYGAHGGGHGHPDKLNMVIWGRNELLSEDPGCIAYGNPAHPGWYRQTLSHNTLVVDGRSQRPATGKLLAFASADNATLCSVDAGDIYDGVQAGRVVALIDDVILDLLWARSDDEHQYEWTFHSRGSITLADLGDEAATPEGDAYQWVPAWRRRGHDGQWQAHWLHEQAGLRVWHRSQAGELWNGVGMGNPATVKLPMVVNRVRGREALFASLMAIHGKDDEAPAGEILDQGMDQAGNSWLRARLGGKEYLLLASRDGQLAYQGLNLQGQAALLVKDSSAAAQTPWLSILLK